MAGVVAWTKLRTVAEVATPETETQWLKRAAELSSRQLEQAAAEAKGRRATKIKIVLELEPEECADLEDAVRVIRRERDEPCSREQAILHLVRRGLGAAAPSARPRFQTVIYRCERCDQPTRESREGPVRVSPANAGCADCDSDIVDARKPERIASTIPKKIRRFVLARDHARCVVPGCSNLDYIDVHHVVFRSRGGTHDPALLATLCDAHHTAVHAGDLSVDGRAPFFRFNPVVRPTLSAGAKTVLFTLGPDPIYVDEAIERSGLPASTVLSAITELELAGVARRVLGGLERCGVG